MSARADTERPIRTPHDAIVTLCELQAEVNRHMRHEHFHRSTRQRTSDRETA